MISNPCKWYANGNETEKFTYEGGRMLFHFSPNDNGLSKSMEANVVFFANDEAHALNVLKRMFEFRIKVAAKYIEATKGWKTPHTEEFVESEMVESKKCQYYVEAIDQKKISVSLAPTNQFFKVGWASNDTIL